MAEAHTLIIGGGIAGASTAFHLAGLGDDVTLVERGQIASEASGANAGLIGAAGWGDTPDLESHLTMGSLQIFKSMQLDMGRDIEFRQSGALTGIGTSEEYDYLLQRVLWLRSHGYSAEMLTPRQARAVEPEASPHMVGYMYSPMRGQADPVKATRAFAEAARDTGALVLTDREAVSIEVRSDGAYAVHTAGGEQIFCRNLVIAAGAWSDPIGRMLGLRVPVVPVRGQMWATESLPPGLFHTISSAESSLAWHRDTDRDENLPPDLTHQGGRRVTRHLYGRQRMNGEIIFGGDRQAVGYDKTIDAAAVAHYLKYLFIPAPATIFEAVSKVLPGHLVMIDGASLEGCDTAFWTLPSRQGSRLHAGEGGLSESDALEQLEALLADSVSLRSVADVPLGALLSGGVDSSLVVAMLQEHSHHPVKTFSVAFDAAEHDEARHARAVAAFLGTDHTELRVDASAALDLIPKIAEVFDEPLADPSQIPTYLICQLTRRNVTVALSGDGGDELFGGYNRYIFGSSLIPRLLRLSGWQRGTVRPFIRLARWMVLATGDRWVQRLAPTDVPLRLFGDKLAKLDVMLGASDREEMYSALLGAGQLERAATASDAHRADPIVEFARSRLSHHRLLDMMMLLDQTYYLPDDLLSKVDRASMAASLEVRVPFLDHRVVEFAWNLPMMFKIQGRSGKWLPKQLLYKKIDRALVDRPKMGFTVPIREWLSGDLTPLCEHYFTSTESRLRNSTNHEVLQAQWERLKRGRGNALGLWAALMLGLWLDRWT